MEQMEEGPQERFVKVILSIANALSQYVLCLFIKVSETNGKDGSTQNRIQ